jgi:hypothetical protein
MSGALRARCNGFPHQESEFGPLSRTCAFDHSRAMLSRAQPTGAGPGSRAEDLQSPRCCRSLLDRHDEVAQGAVRPGDDTTAWKNRLRR